MPAQKGNKHSLKYGGEAAVKAISLGKPFKGLAAKAELAVYHEWQDHGSHNLIFRNAVRLQAAADLYWNAVQKAAEDSDLQALDRYVARFGWLSGAALRAWAQVNFSDSRRKLEVSEVIARVVEEYGQHS